MDRGTLHRFGWYRGGPKIRYGNPERRFYIIITNGEKTFYHYEEVELSEAARVEVIEQVTLSSAIRDCKMHEAGNQAYA